MYEYLFKSADPILWFLTNDALARDGTITATSFADFVKEVYNAEVINDGTRIISIQYKDPGTLTLLTLKAG